MQTNHFAEFSEKMRGAELSEAAIQAFKHNYNNLLAGQTGMIPEGAIQPVDDLPRLERIVGKHPAEGALFSQTLVLKLNGGLGTSMGLERAKSLLQVKNGLTFLDFTAKHILYLRKKFGVSLRFMLMNSQNTSADTLAFLSRYPELGSTQELELMQSIVPKVDAATFRPVAWPANPQLEWCPPGHGDIYPSLLGSGWLDRLLAAGVKFMFVSNSDNLGASLDPDLLGYFANSGKSFLMEVAQRTASDRKGGHLARRGNTFLLRESAQCPEADMAAFQDINKHQFFNTNNLWIRLDRLKELLDKHGGFVPLQMIRNAKTVDPRDKKSPAVIQLETAMGAAIESFENSGAIVVSRARFAPVKTTSDLLALRSDAYAITEDWRVLLDNDNHGQPPAIDLDADHYKLVDQLEDKLTDGVPSLKACKALNVRGAIRFNRGNIFRGKVAVSTAGGPASLPAGTYEDCSLTV
jgi:UDP-N-acetylglucosamine pyrophosphorylase